MQKESPGNSHNSPATDVVEPGILFNTPNAQQEVKFVPNVGWKDISKSVARRHRELKRGSPNMVDTHGDEDDPEYAFAEAIKSKRKLTSSLEDVS